MILTAVSLIFLVLMILWSYAVVEGKRIKCNTYIVNFHMGLCTLILSAIFYPLRNSIKIP